ncbi:hypothetical protein FI667_g913, partial [Globisporangium splendens]
MVRFHHRAVKPIQLSSRSIETTWKQSCLLIEVTIQRLNKFGLACLKKRQGSERLVFVGRRADLANTEQNNSSHKFPNEEAANGFLHEFTSVSGAHQNYYVALFDLPKLMFQTVNLKVYLSEGFPLPLIYFYVALLAINSMISLYRFQRRTIDDKYVARRLASLFDLLFAVFAPFVVLVYAYFNFHLDRDAFAARVQTITPGSFGRIARLFSDPIEIAVFRFGFQNLQLLTGEAIAIKCFLNVLGLYKWNHIVAHLIRLNHQERQRDLSFRPKQKKYHSRKYIWVSFVIFTCCAAGTIGYTCRAVVRSIANCAPYPQCGLISYQWSWDENFTCPCVVYVDRDMAPKTFAEWMDPPDTAKSIAQVAKSWHLQTVQIINRRATERPLDCGCKQEQKAQPEKKAAAAPKQGNAPAKEAPVQDNKKGGKKQKARFKLNTN